MLGKGNIRAGMGVFGADAKRIGTVESMGEDAIQVGGQSILRSAITRVTPERLFVKGRSTDYVVQVAPLV
jgi:hypothetical protein